jgi:voltage-gated potassium channel
VWTGHGRGLFVIGMTLRAVAVATVVMSWYFLAPLNRSWDTATAVALGIGLLLIAAAACWQIWAIVHSPYPRLRAMGALMSSFPLLILLFATSFFLMGEGDPGAFSERLTRIDSLYLTMTVFSTVGFGDITPVSETARVLVMVQMLADLIYVGLLVRALVEAARLGAERRAAEPDSSTSR